MRVPGTPQGWVCLVVCCMVWAGSLTTAQEPAVTTSHPQLEMQVVSPDEFTAWPLENLILDHSQGNVIVGGRNRVYIISQDKLEKIHEILTGPKPDSVLCPPNPEENCTCPNPQTKQCDMYRRTNTTNINRGLALDSAEKVLIACGTAYYGFCQKISLESMSIIEDVYDTILGSSPPGTSLLFVAPGPAGKPVLYVATGSASAGLSQYRQRTPMLSIRNLANLHYVQGNASSIHILSEYRDVRQYEFHGAFHYEGFTYFLMSDKSVSLPGQVNSKLVRVCQNDTTWVSYAEVALDCAHEPSLTPEIITDMYVSSVGEHLAMLLHKPVNETALFVSCVLEDIKSAVSVFPLSTLKWMFTRKVEDCFAGQGQLGPEYLTKVKPCTRTIFEHVECGVPTQINKFIMGMPGVRSTSSLDYSSIMHHVTHLQVKLVDNHAILFLGTKDGHVLQVLHDPRQRKWRILSDTMLEPDNPTQEPVSPVKDMAFDAEKNYLYALTDHKVHKITTMLDCTQFSTCSECAPAHPNCAWCLETSSCKAKEECSDSAIVPFNTQCPQVTKLWPKGMSYQTLLAGKQFHVEVSIAPPGDVTCVLELGAQRWEVAGTKDGSTVVCDGFTGKEDVANPLPANKDHVDVFLSIYQGGAWFTSAEAKIYDCTRHESCESCAKAEYPCQLCNKDAADQIVMPCTWCTAMHKCVDETSVFADCISRAKESLKTEKVTDSNGTDKPKSLPQLILPPSSNYTVEDSDQCPFVKLINEDIPEQVPTSENLTVTFTLYHWQAYQSKLQCRLSTPEAPERYVDADISGKDYVANITCPIKVRADPSVPQIPMKVDIVWNSNNVLSDAAMEVEWYNCSAMAENCGDCQATDVKYNCSWCDGMCKLGNTCKGVATKRDAICPDPLITKFSPTSGHILGGTKLTVTGSNLGRQPSDLEVHIAEYPCAVIKELSKQPKMFVCTTSSASKSQGNSGLIHVAVAKTYNTTSNAMFLYVLPKWSSIQPYGGPVSGKTRVIIHGTHLGAGSNFTVYIGNFQATLIARNNSFAELITPPAPNPMDARVNVTIDGKGIGSRFFKYMPDPDILIVDPLVSLYSQQPDLQIVGRNLMIIQHPKLIIHTFPKVIEPCTRISDNNMTCKVPDMTSRIYDKTPQKLDYGFQMDGVTKLLNLPENTPLSPMVFYPNPELYPFPTEENVISYDETKHVEIWGQGVDVLNRVQGLNVTVGGRECTVALINTTCILCKPPPPPKPMNDDNALGMVMVTVGGFQEAIGHINYRKDRGHLSVAVVAGIIVGLAIPLIILLICCIWCLRKNALRKKNMDGVADSVGNFGHRENGMGAELQMEPLQPRLPPKRREAKPSPRSLEISAPQPVTVPDSINRYLQDNDANITESTPLRVDEGRMDPRQRALPEPPEPPPSISNQSREEEQVMPLGETTDDDMAGISSDEWDDTTEDESGGFELQELLNHIDGEDLRKQLVDVFIPRDRLIFGDMLGKGHFGCVYGAQLKNSDGPSSHVAVKTLQAANAHDQKAVEAFLKEGVIMQHFNHPHVLQLLGVGIDGKVPIVILPFMANGDLRSYVKDKKKSFTARQLLQLGQQVAQGMTYLATLGFVHRDLAARNCMIDESNVVKVADFGLSRDIYERDSYHGKDRKGKMPIKWMALESLQDLIFTTKSDVWSFGILMWELMTRGTPPYPDVDVFDLRDYLTSGRRLFQPKYCPDNVYQLMLKCWDVDPAARPTFTDLVNTIELMLNPPKRPQVTDNEEPLYMNVTRPASGNSLDGPKRTSQLPLLT